MAVKLWQLLYIVCVAVSDGNAAADATSGAWSVASAAACEV